MKFCEIPYERVDLAALGNEYDKFTEKVRAAKDCKEVVETFTKQEQLSRHAQTMITLASIRNSIDTRDKFYEAEQEYYDSALPAFEEHSQNFMLAVMESPFRQAVSDVTGDLMFRNLEMELKTFSPEVIDLLGKENKLVSDYQKLIASAKIDFDGNGEYLILSVTASDTKSPPNENDRQVADKIASSAVITWYGEISYDEEWIEANREIPDELPLFEKGDMVVYTAEEAREKSPYYITALPEYRTVYYWMPYIWTNIISREEYAEWGRRVDTPHDALHAVPQEMDVVSFIKYFKIPKEDFIKACEEEAEYQQNVLKGERGYDINLEEYEIPNADILYTFDNDIINEYYRR